MQISRHWRIKPQRYRLEGIRYQNGDISLQNRPAPQVEYQRKSTLDTQEIQVAPQPVSSR